MPSLEERRQRAEAEKKYQQELAGVLDQETEVAANTWYQTTSRDLSTEGFYSLRRKINKHGLDRVTTCISETTTPWAEEHLLLKRMDVRLRDWDKPQTYQDRQYAIGVLRKCHGRVTNTLVDLIERSVNAGMDREQLTRIIANSPGLYSVETELSNWVGATGG